MRYWIDGKKEDHLNRYSLNKYTKILADNPDFRDRKKIKFNG
ncbi:MAG: hypothetical protein QNJ32_22915 [Xenococcaceae cyanobacterium MO_167.B27]|nr:hypothetical protein [Xenococcaceae cyanobacterium MO_167.B27]